MNSTDQEKKSNWLTYFLVLKFVKLIKKEHPSSSSSGGNHGKVQTNSKPIKNPKIKVEHVKLSHLQMSSVSMKHHKTLERTESLNNRPATSITMTPSMVQIGDFYDPSVVTNLNGQSITRYLFCFLF